jgi:hypothetical protein
MVKTGHSAASRLSVARLSTTRVSAIVENTAVAMALPNTSLAQLTDAAGEIARSIDLRRRSWLSRGRSSRRCGHSSTGRRYR